MPKEASVSVEKRLAGSGIVVATAGFVAMIFFDIVVTVIDPDAFACSGSPLKFYAWLGDKICAWVMAAGAVLVIYSTVMHYLRLGGLIGRQPRD